MFTANVLSFVLLLKEQDDLCGIKLIKKPRLDPSVLKVILLQLVSNPGSGIVA